MRRRMLLLGLAAELVFAEPARCAIIFEELYRLRAGDFETSVRTVGMGGASAGVFWGAPAPWGNPAALGRLDELKYDFTSTRLAPGLANDIALRTHSVSIGYAGIGFQSIGEPLGGARLDYGEFGVNIPGLPPIPPIRSSEELSSWSAGVSLARLAGAVFRDHAGLAEYGDVSFGVSRRHAEAEGLGERRAGDAADWGLQLDVSPTRLLSGGRSEAGGFDLRVGVGSAVVNEDPGRLGAFDLSRAGTFRRIVRQGGAVRARWSPPGWRNAAPFPGAGWLRGLGPLLAFGVAYDRERTRPAPAAAVEDVHRIGAEVDLMGVLSVRSGHVDDRIASARGWTYGAGVELPIAFGVSLRYAFGAEPQSPLVGRGMRHRHGVGVGLDPLAIRRSR